MPSPGLVTLSISLISALVAMGLTSLRVVSTSSPQTPQSWRILMVLLEEAIPRGQRHPGACQPLESHGSQAAPHGIPDHQGSHKRSTADGSADEDAQMGTPMEPQAASDECL